MLRDAQFWAKLDGPRFHPLLAHSADIAAVTRALVSPRSPLSRHLARALGADSLDPDIAAALVFFAGLHDVGKAHHGFQRRRRGDHGLLPSRRSHVKALIAELRHGRIVRDTLVRALSPVGGAHALTVFRTAICHHGRPWATAVEERPPLPPSFWLPAEERDPLAEIERIARHTMAWAMPIASPDWTQWTPLADHLFSGLLTLADWIGSSSEFFAFAPEAEDDPDAYWRRVRVRAEHVTEALGLVTRPVTVATDGAPLLARLFPRVFPERDPTVLQHHLASCALPMPGALVVIESDTGSGKTEAVLSLYARLRAAGSADGLFFALPTRATATAMHTRVQAFIKELHGNTCPSTALSIGGGRDASSIAAAPVSDPQGDDGEQISTIAAAWASQSTRHATTAEVVVGTLDQALLSVLVVRHATMRLTSSVRRLLVVDELHAYDRWMLTALQQLIDAHTAVGGIVVCLSATLSAGARASLRWGDPTPAIEEAIDRPYPSVSIVAREERAWRETQLPALPSRKRRIEWSLAEGTDALAQAITAARDGARVVVIRNTVRGARAFAQSIVAAGAEDALWRPDPRRPPPVYHARYTTEDRSWIDRAVLSAFGPRASGACGILVATQVVEQSLDVDFDFLVSDLCPIDVLLQRIGRLHRHADRVRPPLHHEPRALVIAPEQALSTLVTKTRRPRAGNGIGTVYADLATLELTCRTIMAHQTIEIPLENRKLVETAYHDEHRTSLASESSAWAAHIVEMDGGDMGAETGARNQLLPLDERFTSLACCARFDAAKEARIRTRLGDDRVRVPLPAGVPNLFAEAQAPSDSWVDIDWPSLSRACGIDASDDLPAVTDFQSGPNGTQARLCTLQLSYGPTGWSWQSVDNET